MTGQSEKNELHKFQENCGATVLPDCHHRENIFCAESVGVPQGCLTVTRARAALSWKKAYGGGRTSTRAARTMVKLARKGNYASDRALRRTQDAWRESAYSGFMHLMFKGPAASGAR
jgi:hypothetical protein